MAAPGDAGATTAATWSVEVGQFAVRGGVFDLFPPGTAPSHCGSISSATRWSQRAALFEPESQRSTARSERA